MPNQKCPGCGALNDVSIFVSGQRKLCVACKLPFSVQRSVSIAVAPGGVPAARRRRWPPAGVPAAGKAEGGARPVIRPHPAVEQQEARERARPRARKPEPAPEQQPEPAKDTSPVDDDLEIPGFELFEVIGKGGMGKVYRARQISLDRLVAIKVLNEDLARHRSFVKRFEKETASLAALSHPNISSIIDRGNAGRTWYFVMEYIEGPSLRQTMNRGGLEVSRALELITTLCRAVGHAHRRGVIHRDLKPENVLFTSDGVLKVVDFGLANILHDERRWSMTRTKVSMGTVNYMAPEQRRDAKNVDYRADIYSLGVMLYELLAGELPLGRFDPPSRRRSEVVPRLDKLVLKMLDFDPDRRPQRVELVVATLEAIQGAVAVGPGEAEGVPARPAEEPRSADGPPSGPGAEPPAAAADPRPSQSPAVRRRRLPSAMLFLLGSVLALVVGAVTVFVLLLRSDLSDATADLVLGMRGGAPRVNLAHPRQVKQVPPWSDERKGGRRVVHFDFKPSRLRPVPVRLVGGDWTWEDRRGNLVQDTCRTALTINQRPATAAFGEQRSPEGLRFRSEVSVSASFWDPGSGRVAMQRYLAEHLSNVHKLAMVDSADRVGLGFLDKGGAGILVMLPVRTVRRGMTGSVLRMGEGMEVANSTFTLQEDLALENGRHEMALELSDGRVKARLDGRVLVDELAGLPLWFKGFPAVACQNARCAFHSVEYSQ